MVTEPDTIAAALEHTVQARSHLFDLRKIRDTEPARELAIALCEELERLKWYLGA